MTPTTAIDMHKTNPVGPLASAYLMKCGYSAETIDAWTSETRLLQDIGLCGDDILDELMIMREEFGVDLSMCDYMKFFPSERSMDALLISIRPLLRAVGLKPVVDRIHAKYPPVTLGMIESVMLQRKWFL